MPIIEYRQNSSDINNILKVFANKVTSQNGEDGILKKIFEIIGHENYLPWCIELGAWNGKHLSNTYNLINHEDWKAVLIEGNPQKFLELSENYKSKSHVFPINSMIDFTSENNLETRLSQTPIPKKFGLISIDIDGCDYYLWESLTSYKPTVVIIEFNPNVPNDIIFVQDRDLSLNQGASLLAMIELGKRKGYELIAVEGANAIFTISEFYEKFNIPNNNIHFMKEDSGTRIWQAFDSTIYTHNCSRLRWKGKEGYKINHEDLQVLPKSMRFYRNRMTEIEYLKGQS